MEIGLADDIILNPLHPYTQALLDALPRFGDCGEVRRYGTLLARARRTAHPSPCPFFIRCRLAQETQCGREKPPLRKAGPSHYVACYHLTADEEGPSAGDACFYGT
jgi:oligopeptide/dipeptide ABC transporter ATP-binding protein